MNQYCIKATVQVTGIITANGSVKGLLPGISLISIVLGNEDGWSIDRLKEGIKRAIDLDVDIINISCGYAPGEDIIF